jgi:hypothetical protein
MGTHSLHIRGSGVGGSRYYFHVFAVVHRYALTMGFTCDPSKAIADPGETPLSTTSTGTV